MKNKSWIIILIMGIALTISLAYSIVVSQRKANPGESTVTTKSIIEMTASTVTIKNTLRGSGEVEYKAKESEANNENNTNESNSSNQNTVAENNVNESDLTNENIEEDGLKTYQISLSIEDKDLDKAKLGQEVEISIDNNGENLSYTGEVTKISKELNHKSTINVEVSNPDDKIQEKMMATCTVILEEAKNVVALPIEAIQKNEEDKEFVDVVQPDGTTKQVIIKTGLSDDYYVEITAGLKVGDRVQIVKSSTTVVNENNNETGER